MFTVLMKKKKVLNGMVAHGHNLPRMNERELMNDLKIVKVTGEEEL